MGFSNENIAQTLPAITLSAWISDFTGAGAVPAPTLTATMISSAGPAWATSLTLPAPTIATASNFGWNVELPFPAVELLAEAVTSGVASASITVPAPTLQASFASRWEMLGEVPAPTLEAQAFAVIDWGSTSVVVPAVLLDASMAQTLTAVFQTWCMNANTLGVSEYTEFPVTSMAEFNGKFYATTADGIYELTGATDAGADIDASVLTGVTDYSFDREAGDASMKVKRSAGLYANLRSQGAFSLVVKVDEDKERIYVLTAAADPEGMHPRRAKPGRLLEGRNWQFGFRNAAGKDFHLRDFQNMPIFTSRRI